MLEHDRVICDCCGDDMGQLMGGEPVRSGVIADQSTAPHFAICPDCKVDVSEYLSIPSSREAA